MYKFNWGKWVIAGLVAADLLLFAGLLVDSARNPNHQANAAQGSYAASSEVGDYSRKLVPPIPSFEPPHNQSEAQKDPTRKDERDLLAQEWVAWASFWMLFVTSLGVVFVAMTLRAALQANEGFKRSAEAQLRPYISFKHMHMHELSNHAWSIQAQWENTGQTPTRQMELSWGYLVEPELPGPDFTYPDKPKAIPNEGTIAVGAGAVLFSNGPILTAEQIADCTYGRVKVLYWGWIEYNDSFPNSQRYRSEFCQRLVMVPDVEQTKIGWIAWGPHNGADEDCLKPAKSKQKK